MADATVCFGQAVPVVGEDFAHLAHADTVDNLALVIVDRHTRTFLAAMLQGGEGQCEIAAHIDASRRCSWRRYPLLHRRRVVAPCYAPFLLI